MRYGRRDCNVESPYAISPKDVYPSPHGTYNETTDYFTSEFDLTERETIALLGENVCLSVHI